MKDVSHLRYSDNVLERAAWWLYDLSWSSGGRNFETLQELGNELLSMVEKSEESDAKGQPRQRADS